MNKETELTLKLRGMGVLSRPDSIAIAQLDYPYPWTIKSALAWLREKGYNGYITWGIELSRVQTSKTRATWRPDNQSEVTVKPGHELEGLLECMLSIVEGEK